MSLLAQYYEALGAVITAHEATLTNIAGDGLMVLVNAPVACPDPAWRAVRMAIGMQHAVQALILDWRARGHAIGFGVGLAMGPATVGRVDTGSRLDYTAIGNVVNLASRLCSAANDAQILIDQVAAEAVRGRLALVPLGTRSLKGFGDELSIFAVAASQEVTQDNVPATMASS
jgi:class 3 adenylate cyclase